LIGSGCPDLISLSPTRRIALIFNDLQQDALKVNFHIIFISDPVGERITSVAQVLIEPLLVFWQYFWAVLLPALTPTDNHEFTIWLAPIHDCYTTAKTLIMTLQIWDKNYLFGLHRFETYLETFLLELFHP